jgi:hypothetical protein
MQTDYAFSRCTRRCYLSNRNLEPGEAFYSAILKADESLTRIDIAATAWQGPPEHAVGWWRSRMPPAGNRKLKAAPDSVLLETLSLLLEQPSSAALAYMLALLLVRRRVLTDGLEQDEADRVEVAELWHLQHPVDGRQWSVPMVMPSAEETESVQQELTRLLFTEE